MNAPTTTYEYKSIALFLPSIDDFLLHWPTDILGQGHNRASPMQFYALLSKILV
jgi:hypothetical protein